MPPQFPNPQYIPTPPYPCPFMVNQNPLKGSINPAPNTAPQNPGTSNLTLYPAAPPAQHSMGNMVPPESGPLPSPGGHTMPPNTQTPGIWPAHSQQPLFSLANVLSLAMTMAQSFIPPTTTMPNGLPQAYMPPLAPQPVYPAVFGAQHPSAGQTEASPRQDVYQHQEAQTPAQAPSATPTASDVPGPPGAGSQTGMSPHEGQEKISSTASSSSLSSCNSTKSVSSDAPQNTVSTLENR